MRPLTSLYELITINTLGKVVSSDERSNQFEITSPTQHVNGEEDVCADCTTRVVIENSMCESDDSDDEVPELVYIPELTPEEEEVKVQKKQKCFDQDTIAAIKLSLRQT